MQEFSGDKSIWVLIGICCVAILLGWLLLIVTFIAMLLFPMEHLKIEKLWRVLYVPLSWLQKYAFISGLGITFFRMLLYWLNMAPAFFPA